MNLSSIIFCQIKQEGLKRDSTVAIFAAVAAYGVRQQTSIRSAMKALAENHFVGLHEMVPSVQSRGVELKSSKDHSEEHLGMVKSQPSTGKAILW